MNEWMILDENTVALDTPKGRFVLNKMVDADYAGIFINYQELGKPTRNLAVVEHLLEEDALRTLVSEQSDADEGYLHEIDHERPESERLQQVIQQLDWIEQEYPEFKLGAKLRGNGVLELGYFDDRWQFHFVQEAQWNQYSSADLEYYLDSKGGCLDRL